MTAKDIFTDPEAWGSMSKYQYDVGEWMAVAKIRAKQAAKPHDVRTPLPGEPPLPGSPEHPLLYLPTSAEFNVDGSATLPDGRRLYPTSLGFVERSGDDS